MDKPLYSKIEQERGTINYNKILLILDEHKAYLTLEVNTKTKANGIDMFTLLSHISHGLQQLHKVIFKPFKIAFKDYKNSWYINNIDIRIKKEDLAQ